MADNPFDFIAAFQPGVEHASPGEGLWFVFSDRRMLVLRRGDVARLPGTPPVSPDMPGAAVHYLGALDGVPCFTQDIGPRYRDCTGGEWVGLRELYGILAHDEFLLAGRAYQVLEWDRNHRYCGACGAATERQAQQRARLCPACGMAQYPRLTPAMMALVCHDSELLLARSPRFPDGMYSALAGFVEPGETLEACVRREVEEEVGIQVGELRYFASQSWPFPHSLMVAYVADYAGGEIRVDGDEIVDAAWFRPDALPRIPATLSIAGHLIRTVASGLRDSEAGPTDK